MISLSTEEHLVAVGIFNIHTVLLSFADHIGVSSLIGINPNPVLFDKFEEAVIYTVFFAYGIWIDVLKDFDLDVVSICFASEGVYDFCLAKNGISAHGILRVSSVEGANDVVNVEHIFVFLSDVK